MSKLIGVHRLRLKDGTAVQNPNDFLKFIEKTLEKESQTPKQLSIILGKSTKQVHRYLKQMKNVAKLDGTNYYQLKTNQKSSKDIQKSRQIKNLPEFYKQETIKRWMENNKSKGILDKITWIGRLCTGEYDKNFRVNPDNWDVEETTKLAVNALRQHYNTPQSEEIPYDARSKIRSFILYGLDESLSKEKGIRLGISGEKNKPQLATLHMKQDQYDEAVKILKSGKILDVSDSKSAGNLANQKMNTEYYLKFVFRYWTFCRPSSMYLVKVDDLHFYDRNVNYVKINDEKITDKKVIQALSATGKFEINIYTHRACTLELFEHKTQTTYTKYIFDNDGANALEAYTEERKRQGFKYLFWDNNETDFIFQNYDDIVQYNRNKDNQVFKALFLLVGFSKDSFGKTMRANYALRHFGVQRWLDSTDYNYGFVSEMGWEDINTLRLWYGRRTAQAMQKKVNEVIFA